MVTSERHLRPRQVVLAVVGALPLLILYPLFHLFNLVASQVEWVRTLGLLAVFAGLLVMLALPVAGLAIALQAGRPGWRWFWRAGFYALALGNLALVGLTVFYGNPRLAPGAIVAGALGLVGVLLVAFLRYGEQEQVFVTRMLKGAGLALILGPLAASPVVLAAGLRDEPRIPGAPLPLAPEAARAEAPKRIVLVTFDALRARSTSLSDPHKNLTPAIAEMARESTYYPRFYAASDRTLAAMPALLSGVGPEQVVPRLGNRAGFGRVGATTSLAGHLRSAGYRSVYATMLINPLMFGHLQDYADGYTTSGLFHSNRFNARAFIPIGESFTWLAERATGKLTDMTPQAHPIVETRRTFAQAHRLLKAHPDRAFAWVHLGAPHTPYYDVDPADLDGKLQLKRYAGVSQEAVPKATPAELVRYEAIYERYVRFADHEFGRFKAGLEADGLWDDALVIVTADHGEDFRPGRTLHGLGNLTEEVTHVPLLIHAPHQRTGAQDARVAGHLDLVPTVLDRVFTQVPAGLAGKSLLGPAEADHAAFTWSLFRRYLDEAGLDSAAVVAGRFKYLREERQEFLYDLIADPAAVRNIAAQHPQELARLRERVDARFGP